MLRRSEPYLRYPLPILLLLALSAPDGAAQQQFVELGKQHVPRDAGAVEGNCLADIDGDGDVDLIAAVRDSSGLATRVYLNLDAGVFAAGTLLLRPGGNPFAADVDGDGDLDLLIAGRPATLLLNDGRGNFSPGFGLLPGGNADVFAVGDLDRDGDLDAVVGNAAPTPLSRSTRLWLNDGLGGFTDVSTGQLPGSNAELNRAIVLADFDRDGDLDIAVGSTPYGVNHQLLPGPKRLYLNDGSANFSDASPQLPADRYERTDGMAAGDVDGDGDLDLVLASSGPQSRLFLNDGTGTFSDGSATRFPAGSDGANSATLTDVDFDGDLDLVLGGARGRLWLNDGRGTFADATAARMPGGLDYSRAVAVADVDGDRDPDLVFAWENQNRLLLNDARGVFVDATSRPMPIDARGRPLVFGDVDGDGDLDLVAGSRYTDSSPGAVLFQNDGFGRFTQAPGAMPVDADVVAASLTLADVDGDGDLDFLFIGGLQNTFPKLYRNGGSGTFTDVTATQMPRTSANLLVVGDVDGDGDQDVVFGQRQGENGVLLNDGRGAFALAAGRFPQESNWPSALALGDVDGDGDLDLLLGPADYATFRNRTKLYLNDGTGRFTDVTLTQMPALDNLTNALALGDVDGDGDLDLVLGNWGTASYPNERHRLYLNDGGGRFTDGTAGRLPDVLSGTYDAKLADADADGDLDLVLANYGMGDRLYLNDGTGTFTDTPGRFTAAAVNASVQYATGDVDEDGDQDLFLSETGFLTNLHRQSDAPLLARPGRAYPLDLYSSPGQGVAPHVALPYVAAVGARIPLPPFGVLGLAPAAMIPLPPVLIPRPSGKGTLPLAIPNDPALLGGVLRFQALIVPSAQLLEIRFTNVTFDPLR